MTEFARAIATTAEVPPAAVPTVAVSAVRLSRRAPSRRALSVALTVTILGVGATAWWLSHRNRSADTATPVRLAVLPYLNLGDSSRLYLADGITDAVRGKLAAVPAIQVIASTSSEEYRGSRKSMKEIGRELDVPYVLLGKVRWIGGAASSRIQVSSELVNTATGSTRWQAPMDATDGDLTRLPGEISGGIVTALEIKLAAPERTKLAGTSTTDSAAYDAYLRGLERMRAWDKGAVTSADPAIRLFERALALDSGFVMAKVRLADVLRQSARRDSAQLARSEGLAAAALQAQPDLPEALVVQGEIKVDRGDREEGYRLLRRAAEIQPNNAFVLGRLTWLQGMLLDSLALSTGRRAVALAPRDADMLRLVVAGTYGFRRFDEVEAYSDRLIALDPSDYMGYLNKALARVNAYGDTAGAVRTLSEGESMVGQLPLPLAWGYAASGPSGWQRWDRLLPRDLAIGGDLGRLDFYWWKGLIAAAEGRKREQRAYADSLVLLGNRIHRHEPDVRATVLASRSYGYAVRGERAKAEADLAEAAAALETADPAGREQYQSYLVPANLELGRIDQALAISRRQLEHPIGVTRTSLLFTPEYAGLWRRPEFKHLVSDSSLP